MTNRQISDTADAIVKQFKDKDVKLELTDVMNDLNSLVIQYGLPINEAMRSIIRKEAKKHDVKLYIGSSNTTVRNLSDLIIGEWATIKVLCVYVSKPPVKSIHQAGIFSDSTKSMKFTAWARDRKNDKPLPIMKKGHWYKIESCIVNDYKGTPIINLQKNSVVTEINDEEDVVIITPFTKLENVTKGVFSARAKIVKLFDTKSDKLQYSGIIGDETKAKRFVLWSSTHYTGKLEEGKSYEFNYFNVDTIGDSAEDTIILTNNIKEISENIEVTDNVIELIGNIVAINQGSGVIKRCTVPDCKRALDKYSMCPIHELQKTFDYDMRIKAIIDDGEKSYYANISKPISEKLTGMKLEDLIEYVETNPLGYDNIINDIVKKLVGKYYTFKVIEIDNRLIVKNAIPLTFEQMEEYSKIPIIPYGDIITGDGV